MDSAGVVGKEHIFVEGDIVRNKYWVVFVNLSKCQSLVECCCLIYI